MPIKPEPYYVECPKCYWSMRVAPSSDVIMSPLERPDHCLNCGNKAIQRHPDSITTKLKLLISRRKYKAKS